MKISRWCVGLTLLLTLSLSVVGCSKDKGVSGGRLRNQLLVDPLLLKLPASTAAFAIFDLDGESYKLFKNSPYAKTANARDVLESIQEKLAAVGASKEALEMAQNLFDACGKMGLVSAEGVYTPEKVVRRTVFFASPASNQKLPLDFGLFSQAAKGVDLTQQLKTLRVALQEAGVETTAVNIAGGEGFSATIQNAEARLYFGANPAVLGASISQTAVEGLLSKNNTTTLSALQELPEYKRAVTAMPAAPGPLAFAFTSVNRFGPLLESLAALDESGQFNPKDLPLEAVAVQSSFAEEYAHNIGLAITPRSESQTKIIKALESSALPSSATKLPSDTAVALSLDPRFIQSLDSFMNEVKNSTNSAFAQQLEFIRGITIGIRNNAGGAPIPDVLMSIDSSNRETLNSSIESSLGSLLATVGQAASWQTKEVAGNPTRFFSTLIGAGVYMSAPKSSNTLMLGTSEGVIKDLAASQSGQGANVLSGLSSNSKGQLTSANVALLYLNFTRIADVVDSIKGTLAMFTGGNSELNDLLNAANIRAWGVATGNISYAPGAMLINASMNPPKN
jgi:hypothetical protein